MSFPLVVPQTVLTFFAYLRRSSIKVITIVGLLILGLVLDLGGSTSNHDRIGFRYWVHPGPFNQFNGIAGAKGRFLAWWIVLTQAAFSFTGTEIVAVSVFTSILSEGV